MLIAAQNPPFRSLVGLDAQLMTATRTLLPKSAFHWVLRTTFGC
jgi:hypothetical protein